MTGFANTDIPVSTLQSGSTPAHRLQHNGLNAVIRELLTQVYDAREYGALPDSGSDEKAHIQAAIDAAAAAGGGTVRLLAGTYLTTDTLTIADTPVTLEGAGKSVTIIKRSGTSVNTVVYLKTTNGQSDKMDGGGVRHLTIDGNGYANYGLRITTVNGADISHDIIKGCSTYQILMDCWDAVGGGEDPRDNQMGCLRNLRLDATGVVTATGLHTQGGLSITGNSTLDANTSYWDFSAIWVGHKDGRAYNIANSDDCVFTNLQHFRVSGGSGEGMRLRGSGTTNVGHARYLTFSGLAIANGAALIAENGTQPSGPNLILGLSKTTGAVAPTIQSGASLKYMYHDGTGN